METLQSSSLNGIFLSAGDPVHVGLHFLQSPELPDHRSSSSPAPSPRPLLTPSDLQQLQVGPEQRPCGLAITDSIYFIDYWLLFLTGYYRLLAHNLEVLQVGPEQRPCGLTITDSISHL